ncbi:facilitated trehalose transporter Tret1-like [Eriocheir sinensis]|uniref:facilitated trehalose transporter Tret1-like n=1 Tax=Eriocheir sinensis TaxID=95602 RepID=UPI0021C68A0B|nr:facilitated trehalose transporter Tret1-like [Eriocheir sinensis]
MAPNENATNTVVEECVPLQEPLYPSNTKPQIIATEKYGASVRSKKRRYENWKAIARQVLAAAFASLSSVSIGFITGYSSLTLQQLRNDTSIDYVDSRDSGWIASLPSIASIVGSLMGGFMMDAMGPRMTLVVTALPCLFSWAFLVFANSITLLYVGRVITGIFLGIFSPVPQVYATEIAEPRIRGMMGAFPEAAVALGSLLCYGFGSVTDWRWLAVVSALVPGVPLFLSMIFLPESPQWLIKKGKLAAAEKSIRFFRPPSHCVKAELDTIHTNIIETDGAEISVWEQMKLFRKSQNWKPVVVVFLVFMCGQFSGFAVVTAYTADIFNEAGTNIDPDKATVIVGLVRIYIYLVSAVLLDRVGRKPLLIISAIGSSGGMVSIGTFFYLKEAGVAEGLGLLPLASLLIYVFFNELGYGPIPWLLSGELIPLAVRTIGNGVAVTAYSLFAFIIGLTFPMLTSLMYVYVVFWMYALFSLSGVILGIFLPETRGKTLEEIEKFFAPKGERVSEKDFERCPLQP